MPSATDHGSIDAEGFLTLRGRSEDDEDLYVMINASQEPAVFRVQEGVAAGWRRVIDTSRESPDDFRVAGDEERLTSVEYSVGPRSIVVLIGTAAS